MTFVAQQDPKAQPFKLHDKQEEALALLRESSQLKEYLLLGGSRSGKTFFGIHLLVVRALKYPESRHIVCRLRFSHAKTSLWMDTLPKVLKAMGLREKRDYTLNKTDFVVTFKNKSEFWIDGLDNAERVEKMLGREYNTIYYNEISQIPYDTVTTVQSRLAMRSVSQRYGVCRNIALFDCNPPTKKHWSYILWFLHQDPADPAHPPLSEKRKDGLKYIKMNPQDNLDNVGADYIEILQNLPERKRKRFMDGEYSDVEGQIFENWEIVSCVPAEIRRVGQCTLGCDFGFTTAPAVMLRLWYVKKLGARDQLWIEQLEYNRGLTNPKLAANTYGVLLRKEKEFAFQEYRKSGGELDPASWTELEYTRDIGVLASYMDPHEPKSRTEMQEYWTEHNCNLLAVPGLTGPDSVRAGIDWLQGVDMYVTQESSDVIQELETYEYIKDEEGNSTPEPSPKDNHAMDALRYGCTPHIMRNTATKLTLSAE